MKTGLTIQQMAQELLRQSKAKQDYLVNTGSLSLSVTTDAPQLRVTENGLDKIAPLDIRQTAHRQLGTYLGIPQKYYELMRTDAPELLAYNANYWFSQKNELRTLRTMDGCARAFLSNRYRRIDNLDIASVTLPVIGELPEARFVSTQITDDFMYIKVVNPRLQADVVPGDVVLGRATASARSPMNWCWTTGRASPIPFPRSVRFAGRLSGSAEKRCAEDE